MDPSKKRTPKKYKDYYNPEDNPYKHAVETFNEFNMGQDSKEYTEKVKDDINNLKYLLKEIF
jgi:hypothetical protein